MVENNADMIVLLDANGKFQYVSASYQRSLGYAPEELLGVDAFRFVHPADREAMQKVFSQEVVTAGQATTSHARVLHKDGTWRVIEATAQNLLSVPEVTAVVVNARDITSRIRIEEELREREELLTAILESMSEGVFVLDVNFRYTYVNRAMVQLTGVSIEQILTDDRFPWVQFPRRRNKAWMR